MSMLVGENMKKLLSFLLVIMMTIVVFACKNTSSTVKSDLPAETQLTDQVEKQEDSEKIKVGISMPNTLTQRWIKDGENLKNGFEQKGYEVYLSYSDNNVDKQISDIESFIANDVNLLVITAVDSKSLASALSTAKAKNIPVVSFDRFIMNSDAVNYYVSFDNYAVGRFQGEFVEEQLDLKNTNEKYNIEFFAGDITDNNAALVFNGAYDILKQYIEKGTLVVPSGQNEFEKVTTPLWSESNAMERMKNIVSSYYSNGEKLDVALCSGDTIALGVTEVIESDYKGGNKVLITGEDGADANLKNIIDEKQTMTVYKSILNEATVAVSLGEALIKGEKPDANFINNSNWSFDCKYDISSYDNGTGIIPSFILTPTVVTKDNLQKELVDTGYYHIENGYPIAN